MPKPSAQPMRRQPEQARAKRNLSAMLDAAAQLVGEHGADGFSMAELARRAGVSKPALYRYFPNKRAVLFELAQTCFQQNHDLLRDSLSAHPGDLAQALRAALTIYCELHRSQPFRSHLRAAMHADPELMALDLADTRSNAALVQDALGQQYPDVDHATLRHHLLLIMGCADAVAQMSTQVDPQEAAQLIDRFVQMSTCCFVMPAEQNRQSMRD